MTKTVSVYNSGPIYHESLLHWVWKNRHVNYQDLQTTVGQEIIVHNPGTLNKSDGPDFSNAEITIGNLRWYGDIEIHWRLSDWTAHKHQEDVNFENVILHVVFEETECEIERRDGSTIPTLCLSACISASLHSFIKQYQSRPQLPCAGHLSFISEEAFQQQLEKAHKEYFEQKVNDLLAFYDSNLPPSMAWQKMLVIALFDGLGISHNRSPMQKLAKELFTKTANVQSADELREKAITISGISSNKKSVTTFHWKRKGCRPGNHPLPRIKQGADILWYVHRLPFKQWMNENPRTLWSNMRNSIDVNPSLGKERAEILFGTVFLPALYSLGDLFYSKQLTNTSWELWQTHQAHLPDSLLQILHDTSLPASIYAQKLGTIYQLRTYCYPRKCQYCEVFKSAIFS
ncbi:MAG TPA: DUF2851 family protein [Balneolaceae bacterium]|nr:DUF2851 family protein [Balneolaceae bacterium]